jgi:hypothetical protein
MEHRNSILAARGVRVEAHALVVGDGWRDAMGTLDARGWSNRQSAVSLVWALRLLRQTIGEQPSEADLEVVGSVLSFVAIGEQYLDVDSCFSPGVEHGIRGAIASELCGILKAIDGPLRTVELRAAESQSADVASVTAEWLPHGVDQPESIGRVTGMWETSYNIVSAESLSMYVFVLLDFARWALTGAKSMTVRNSAGRLVERLVGTEALPRRFMTEWIRETRLLAPTKEQREFIEHSTRQQS